MDNLMSDCYYVAAHFPAGLFNDKRLEKTGYPFKIDN